MSRRRSKNAFGVIVGNRGFFPDALAKEGYEFITRLLERLGYEVVVLSQQATKFLSFKIRKWTI